jgi:hypothetical protein
VPRRQPCAGRLEVNSSRPRGTVYLLHFSEPYRHAAHYIGWTAGELEERLRLHQSGAGARLLEVVTNAGISFELARTWEGGRQLERCKKRQGGAAELCPICRAAGRRRRRSWRR